MFFFDRQSACLLFISFGHPRYFRLTMVPQSLSVFCFVVIAVAVSASNSTTPLTKYQIAGFKFGLGLQGFYSRNL